MARRVLLNAIDPEWFDQQLSAAFGPGQQFPVVGAQPVVRPTSHRGSADIEQAAGITNPQLR